MSHLQELISHFHLSLPIISAFLLKAFGIVTLLGGVIAVHEFGHFIFAKWCGIRVDTFSIGFGPNLFSRKYGETEYCLKLIPLGGFVKIYGQDPEELVSDPTPQPERAFVKKNLIQKISVLFGGPLFNLILASLIFAFFAMMGIEKIPASATRVVYETPAYKAGLRSGDIILSIDSQPTKMFDDIMEIVAKSPDKTLRFSILRDGAPYEINVPVQKEHALTPYGEESMAGVLTGLDPLARESIVATNLATHPWGIQYGDRITEIEDVKINSWEEMEKTLARLLPGMNATLRFKVMRGRDSIALQSTDLKSILKKLPRRDSNEFLEAAGLHNPELFIKEVMKGAPADLAGLKPKDRVISINGQRVYSFEHLRDVIQNAGELVAKNSKTPNADSYEKALKIKIERDGKEMDLVSSINSTKGKDPLGKLIITYTIGILSDGRFMKPTNVVLERTLNPFKALWIGTNEMVNNSVMTVIGLKKVVFGEVSAKTMGGPIMIGKLAGDSIERSWRDFLQLMAIISISLGIFNLLPVPILDGGHIVFAIMESILRKPMSQQVQQMALKVGLSLILLLMVFAFYNDITRMLPF